MAGAGTAPAHRQTLARSLRPRLGRLRRRRPSGPPARTGRVHPPDRRPAGRDHRPSRWIRWRALVDAGVEGLKLHPCIVRGERVASTVPPWRTGSCRAGGIRRHCQRTDPPYAAGGGVPGRPPPNAACCWHRTGVPAFDRAITGQLARSGPRGSALGQPWRPPQAGDHGGPDAFGYGHGRPAGIQTSTTSPTA